MARMMSQRQLALESRRSEAQNITNTKRILQRLRPEAAGQYIRSLRTKLGKAAPEDSQPSPAEDSMSASSSSTIKSKHVGPSDDSSSASTVATTAAKATDEKASSDGSLKRKRTEDDEELDEVAERVKRLKVERDSLWEGFDDSQFNMNSGLLYDSKLWEWYW